MLGRFELLVEVVDTGDEPLRKIALLASLKTGTYQEMQEMWASAYEKCNKPDSCGIEFTE